MFAYCASWDTVRQLCDNSANESDDDADEEGGSVHVAERRVN